MSARKLPARVDRSTAPLTEATPPLRPPQIQRFALSNGLPVLLVEKHDLPLVAVEILLPGGAAAVTPSRAGLAGLTADMLDEGAGKRSALEIATELERLGALLGTSAGYDDSHVHMLALRPRLAESLDLLADLIVRPTFPPHELERVREERLDLILKLSAEPRSVANDLLSAALYGPAHPWGPPLLGTRDSLTLLGGDDVAAFHASRYHAGNATLMVAGDVTASELERLLEARLGAWERGETSPVVLPPAPVRTHASVHIADRPGAAQSEIRVGRVAVARSTEDYFAIVILNTLLGGSFTSRLNATLREEKGFTYGARSGFHTRRAPGPFVAQAAVHTPVTAEAVGVFLEEIERLREEPVPEEELDRTRSYAALRLPQRFETVGDLVARLAEQVLHDLPDDYWVSYMPKLLAVDASAVQAAAQRHLDPRRMTVVVDGDAAVIQGPIERLGLPVELMPEGAS